MEQCERTVRTDYCCHLMVPGKKQPGPVSLVAKHYREALPALAWLMEHIHHEEETSIRVRFHRNFKDDRDQVLEGTVIPLNSHQGGAGHQATSPYWLFQSPVWSVLTCNLLGTLDSGNDGKHDESTAHDYSPLLQERVAELQTCLDNLEFQMGKHYVGKLDIFVDPFLEYAFAVGDPDQAEMMRLEIRAAFQSNDPHSD
jgi:hypothetical protein